MEQKDNTRAICALKLVQSYVESIEKSSLNNTVVEKEKLKNVDGKINLTTASRLQFKRV